MFTFRALGFELLTIILSSLTMNICFSKDSDSDNLFYWQNIPPYVSLGDPSSGQVMKAPAEFGKFLNKLLSGDPSLWKVQVINNYVDGYDAAFITDTKAVKAICLITPQIWRLTNDHRCIPNINVAMHSYLKNGDEIKWVRPLENYLHYVSILYQGLNISLLSKRFLKEEAGKIEAWTNERDDSGKKFVELCVDPTIIDLGDGLLKIECNMINVKGSAEKWTFECQKREVNGKFTFDLISITIRQLFPEGTFSYGLVGE